MVVTVAAVSVSWLGVRLGVAPTLTAEAPVAIDVNRRYTEVRLGLAEATTAPATPPPTSARPSPSRSPSPSPSAPAKPRPKASRSPSPSPSPTPTTSAPDRRPRYRIPADGGAVTVAYSATRVDVVDADPNLGYVASATRRSDTLLVILLAGPGHTSIITAYWNSGPGAQIAEEYSG
ncbi:hypothetical protein ACWKSP_23060 [Micromonosporaceae bacterium Da 78-11]